ncbi:cyclophilin-like fold protein [Paenibacillus macerans]|uniref:cyclophilin-like fold protein n=1 Tax=Paenibacillus macerans TaxID=44252 RepID=UPI00203FFB13|nr:cyclophilin-like fold protein [Paenibacillus macerans]MCM3701931.1 cyclophilin-like fold protein [Paenibacillus macerans]
MGTQKIEILIDEERIVVELYVDKAPKICNMIMDNLPVEGIIQHAKLNGQLIFATIPFSCEFENKVPGGALTTGDVAFYNPRNQLCFLYGQGTDEPLPISHIGRIVEGMDRLEIVGMKNWLKQGSFMSIKRVIE